MNKDMSIMERVRFTIKRKENIINNTMNNMSNKDNMKNTNKMGNKLIKMGRIMRLKDNKGNIMKRERMITTSMRMKTIINKLRMNRFSRGSNNTINLKITNRLININHNNNINNIIIILNNTNNTNNTNNNINSNNSNTNSIMKREEIVNRINKDILLNLLAYPVRTNNTLTINLLEHLYNTNNINNNTNSIRNIIDNRTNRII